MAVCWGGRLASESSCRYWYRYFFTAAGNKPGPVVRMYLYLPLKSFPTFGFTSWFSFAWLKIQPQVVHEALCWFASIRLQTRWEWLTKCVNCFSGLTISTWTTIVTDSCISLFSTLSSSVRIWGCTWNSRGNVTQLKNRAKHGEACSSEGTDCLLISQSFTSFQLW